MKKLADISSFESLQKQSFSGAASDVSVFNRSSVLNKRWRAYVRNDDWDDDDFDDDEDIDEDDWDDDEYWDDWNEDDAVADEREMWHRQLDRAQLRRHRLYDFS